MSTQPQAISPAADPSEWIERAASEHPRRLFLSTPAGRELSYRSLQGELARWAAALERCGVAEGERVAVRVEKSVEAVLLYLACLHRGAVFVPVNVASAHAEVEYLLADCGAHLVVVDPAERAALKPLSGGARLETLGADGGGTLAELLPASAAHVSARHAPGSAAAIVYTSGTTGRAKGAVLSRANLASNAAALASSWRFSAQDVLLHVLPLYHVHGLFTAINTVLASAGGMRLLARFDPAAAVRELAQASVFMGVPTHYTRLLAEPALSAATTARVRLFVSGSAPLLVETHQEFLRRTGHTILERYGMTETLMNTSNPYDGPRIPGSVGPPLPGISVRVSDPDSGALLEGADRVGALEIRGPNVFSGYWRDADKTRAAFSPDGWFKSGDLGRIDAAGYVYIVGRLKDLIISGGYNVYPKEVEMELDALPGVLESAVFGVPHADFGEGVTAAVVPEPGAVLSEHELLELLRPRLARYKLPKRILLVPELPRNAMGKVQKNALRTAHAALYLAP